MTEFEQQQLQLLQQLNDKLQHTNSQLDLMHHSLYVTNEFLLFSSTAIGLIAALSMFLIGFTISKGKG